MAWEPETMVGRRLAIGRSEDTAIEPGDEVRCRCGRLVQAQMMVKVTALPEQARGPKVAGKPLPDYLCDGCRETMIRTGKIKRSEFARALGAPATTVKKIREQE